MSEVKIRNRVSYKMFEQLSEKIKEGEEAALDWLHQELDRRNAYGSRTASLYAQESLELFKKDNNIGNG